MPRLFHWPPKYRFHKTIKQAVVSFFGKHTVGAGKLQIEELSAMPIPM